MRVVAGAFRGRLLQAPAGTRTRPITDRVKETLFNILGHRCATPGALPDIDVLDVFAGSGSLGIEALSRGARSCTFVERDRRALHALRENLRRLSLGEVTTVLTDNAWTMRTPHAEEGFALIFVDPPYRDAADTLRVVDLLERLAPICRRPDGLIIFRHEMHVELPVLQLCTLEQVDERAFGRMRLVLLTHIQPEAEQRGCHA